MLDNYSKIVKIKVIFIVLCYYYSYYDIIICYILYDIIIVIMIGIELKEGRYF